MYANKEKMHVEKSTQNLFLLNLHGSIQKFSSFLAQSNNRMDMLMNLGKKLVK